MTWHNGQPVLSRLPQDGYQDNEAVQALTGWVDENLTNKAEQLQNLYIDLTDPSTCKPEWLDFLAWCCGLSGSYWDTEWPIQVKRTLIANSHTVLWSKKGTLECIQFVLNAHGLLHSIWTDGDLVLPFPMPGIFGEAQLRFFVRLPVKYNRKAKEFREVERTIRNFSPAIVDAQVCYDVFRLGISRLGEPMFPDTGLFETS